MRFIYVISLFVLFHTSWGQQSEHYTQYQFNHFALNPAVAGTKPCLDIRTGYRLQWFGIDGAPKTGFANGHAPLRFSPKKRYTFGPKNGIGILVSKDELGPFGFSQASLAYALHLPINRKWKMSFGLGFGIKQMAFAVGQLTTEFEDPAIANSDQSFLVFPDGRFGMWLADKRTYFGFSILNIFGNRIEQVSPDARLQRHVTLTAGRKLKLEKGWTFVPSILAIKTKAAPLNFHLSALFDLENKFAIGVGLRRTDAITAQIRVKLFNFISIGYSFDYVISKLNKNIWYTHELTSGFNSCSNYGNSSTTSCPTFE